MALLPSTHSNNLTPRKGIVKIAPKNADGTSQAAINLSPSESFVYTQSPETATYVSEESGLAEILDETTLSLGRVMTVACNNLSDEIKALYFGAVNTQITAAGGSVTGEESSYAFPNRSYQLGGSAANGGSIFNVSAVTATFLEGTDAADRANSTAYSVGDFYVPATPNNHFYVCTVAGTSDSSPPTFTTDGSTFTDGTATFRDVGLIAIANTGGADFEVDATYGVVNYPSTGAVATAVSRIPASIRALGRSVRLEFAYTVAASTYNRLESGEAVTVSAEFWFYEQNPKGTKTVWYCPSVSVSPTGDLSGKSGSEYGSAEFTVTVLKPAAASAMYQNGVPVA